VLMPVARTHQISIRLALGVTRWGVLRMVLGECSRLVVLGAALASWSFGTYPPRVQLLFGDSAQDPPHSIRSCGTADSHRRIRLLHSPTPGHGGIPCSRCCLYYQRRMLTLREDAVDRLVENPT
jgi:hypothetical protein